MEAHGFRFNSINEICEFCAMTITDQSNYFMTHVKDRVKAYGEKTRYFIYDENKRLWVDTKDSEFLSFMYNWYNQTTKNIRQLIGELQDKRIQTLINNFDKSSYINNIIDRCKGNLYDEDFVKTMNAMNEYLPILEGKKINLKTGEVTDRVKEDKFTFECQVKMTESTKNAEKYFTDLFPNVEHREYVRRCLGYFLTGDTTARCFFVFYGIGKNGKTMLSKLMDLILNKFYHQCSEEVFKEKTHVGGATPHLYSLMGKRLGIYSEGKTADQMELNFSNLKQVSGEDKIYARGLYRDPVDFYSTIKLVLLTNYTPPLSAEKAIKDRLRYIFFDQKFSSDPKKGEKKIDFDFVEKLEKEYLNEVFTWIVKGAIEYYKTKEIVMPNDFQERTTNLLKAEDSIETFITRFITKTNDQKDYIKRSILFETYQNFCKKNSQRCQPRSSLYNRLEHLGFVTKTLDGYDVFRFIKCSWIIDNTTETTSNEIISQHELLQRAYLKNQELEKEIKILKKEKEQALAKCTILENELKQSLSKSKFSVKDTPEKSKCHQCNLLEIYDKLYEEGSQINENYTMGLHDINANHETKTDDMSCIDISDIEDEILSFRKNLFKKQKTIKIKNVNKKNNVEHKINPKIDEKYKKILTSLFD